MTTLSSTSGVLRCEQTVHCTHRVAKDVRCHQKKVNKSHLDNDKFCFKPTVPCLFHVNSKLCRRQRITKKKHFQEKVKIIVLSSIPNDIAENQHSNFSQRWLTKHFLNQNFGSLILFFWIDSLVEYDESWKYSVMLSIDNKV